MTCGTRLPEAPAEASERTAVAGERRVVSVLFADLSGFTSYSERTDPEEVRALADEAAARLGDIVERYGGGVDKIIGDAVMAVFGAPISHEDDPERAVRAALDMQAYVTEHSETFAGLPLRIGINTGEAMYAPVGRGGQYTVIGDTVNTSARLQSGAGKGEVLVGESTYRATVEAIEFEASPPITAKGKEEPVVAWRARSVIGARPTKRAATASLVGRTVEFDRLWELWERVRTDGKPYLATILGAPGVGKSRLLTEVTGRLEGMTSVHWGRCLPYGEGITYWPVIEVVKDAAGILQSDDATTDGVKVGTFLEGLGSDDLDELRTMAAALATLIAAPTTPRGTYTVTEISQPELHWGLRRILELLAARRPVVLVFEDLHWAEPTLLELLEYLLEADAPILVLGTARPELKETAPGILADQWNRRLIELQTLSEAESGALLTELLGGATIPEGPLGKLLQAAAGNPLFLEETVRMLMDAGVLDSTGRPVEGAATDVAIPSSLHSLIGSRLDRLGPPERRLAEHASVVGNVFWPGAVAHLDGAVEDIEGNLGTLEDRDIIHEHETSTLAGEREYAFKHILVRDVAYGRLSKGRRAQLHLRCSGWVAGLSEGEEEFIEIVAYHLEEACRLASEVKRSSIAPPILPAVKALTQAAAKARRREGTREAQRFYARALGLLGGRFPETGTEIRLLRSQTLTELGELKTAREELSSVVDGAARTGRRDLRCGALVGLADIDEKQGRASEARRRLSEAESLAADVGDLPLQVRTRFQLSALHADFEKRADEAEDELREALVLAEELDDLSLRVEGHLRLGTLLFNLGRLAEAEDQLTRCEALAGAEGSLRDQAMVTLLLSFVKFYRGEVDEAERLALQTLQWLERTADRYFEIQDLRCLAKFALWRGDAVTAQERLDQALPMAVETGGWLAVEINRYLAEALSRQGKVAEAREAAEAARACLPEEDLYARAALSLADAFVATAEGDEDTARRHFTAALPLLEEQALILDHGEAMVAFARALRRFGDHSAAREHLDRARELFAGMEAWALVQEIDRELAEMAGEEGPAAPLPSS
jgi:class 3 adenylate cyclase/tetratricopeptide (TPR) repeat protein